MYSTLFPKIAVREQDFPTLRLGECDPRHGRSATPSEDAAETNWRGALSPRLSTRQEHRELLHAAYPKKTG